MSFQLPAHVLNADTLDVLNRKWLASTVARGLEGGETPTFDRLAAERFGA